MNRTERTTRMARTALLAAISLVLMLLIRIPFPPAPFLVYDPADIPIIISAFAFGPAAGLAITFVVSFIQAFAMAGDGIIGFLMHMLSTGIFVVLAGLLYKKHKTRKRAVLSLIVGSLVMVATMIGWNLIITPLYLGVPREAVIGMILPILLPFNLIKAVVNSVVTFLIYKPIAKLLHK